MKFEELDLRMRVFETAHDHSALPGLFLVARLDGRSFTRLARDVLELDAPFDVRFRDAMIAALRRLMECGFGVVYGYTQSDEISLLFHRGESTFGRKLRKFESILASEASAAFTHAIGTPAAFDGRVSQLPTEKDVVDYFRWRQEDAHRNALSGHCYWLLRGQGQSQRAATRALEGASVSARHELLFHNGLHFDALPSWQKRGIGAYWETFVKPGRNPRTGVQTQSTRRRVKLDLELPMRRPYEAFVSRMLGGADDPRVEAHDHEVSAT
ncbi:MAG: guanylyltransferase [Sandaracinus sp.]|nr:guanylyltransferase [Sandaracinus sp.]